MEKQIISFSANEQILKKTAGQERFADDVVGYIEAHFDLGDNWSGYDSIRAVWFTAFAQISTVLDHHGVCLVPPEVCNRKEAVNVNLVGSIVENDELTDRLTTYPIVAFIFDGNARVDGTETAPVTPSQFEQYVAIVEALVGSVKDIDHATLNADYTLTIYYSDGTSDTVGPIRGEQGPIGQTGNGIASIAKTGTSGTNPVVDTYTITYTNGQTTTFTVTNGVKGDTGATGNGIQSVYKTGTSGLVDTYTILYTNGNTTTFEVTNGQNGSLASSVLAPTYSSSATYAVGDYVYYSGNLYRCVTAITTAEAWTSAHWTQVALAPEVADLKSNLILSFDGRRTFMGAGSFAQGGLDTDTSLLPSQHWRVSNDAPMSFDRDITISVKSGFMWGYDLAGVSGSWHGWYTTPTTIPANTSFVLQISRTVTDTSEYANVDEFVSALTFEDGTSALAHENQSNLLDFENYINPYYLKTKQYGNDYFFTSGRFEYVSGTLTIDDENPLTLTVTSSGRVRALPYEPLDLDESKICLDVVEASKKSARATIAFFTSTKAYISQVDQDFSNGKAFISASIPSTARYWGVFLNEYESGTYVFEDISVYYGASQILEKDFADVIKANCGILGMKWSAMGDSLTAPSTLSFPNKNYVDYVEESLGLTATNLGWGGTGYINDGGASKAFWQRYNTIPADTDVLTIFGSLNDLDLAYNNVGGLKDNNTTTLYGCMNTFLNGVYSINAGMRVGMILPTPWQWMNRRYPGEATTLKTEQYINALIDFAKFNSIPILNLFDESGMHPWDDSFRTTYYKNSDGTHPNSLGHYRFIYPKVKAFIEQLVSK